MPVPNTSASVGSISSLEVRIATAPDANARTMPGHEVVDVPPPDAHVAERPDGAAPAQERRSRRARRRTSPTNDASRLNSAFARSGASLVAGDAPPARSRRRPPRPRRSHRSSRAGSGAEPRRHTRPTSPATSASTVLAATAPIADRPPLARAQPLRASGGAGGRGSAISDRPATASDRRRVAAALLERSLQRLEHAHDAQPALGPRARLLAVADALDEVAALDPQRLLVRDASGSTTSPERAMYSP